jgi:carbon monoxide dehydrogenase subunit G
MKLEHSFEVGLPPRETFELLLDVPRIATCMPGASLVSVDGDKFTGTVRVKLGPIAITYGGEASILERDPDGLRAVIDARGREHRGSGEANARVEATLHATDGGTRVDIVTDLAVTGKPAQFGRGLMVEVGRRLIGQFASSLAADIEATSKARPAAVPAQTEPTLTTAPGTSVRRPPTTGVQEPNDIDVFGLVGGRLAKYLFPVLTALAAGWLLGRYTARPGRG